MRRFRSWPSGMACIRTSTIDQIDGIEYQERDLKAVGIEKLFRELTSAIGTRPQFEGAMAFMREGDVLIVTKLDRLARSVPDLCSIVTKLETKGIALRILAMNFDTSTPTGKLMLIIFGSIAQFEREIMLERHREGVTNAKSQGKYKGRAPTARAEAAEVRSLDTQGRTRQAIADQLKNGIASVYRILKELT